MPQVEVVDVGRDDLIILVLPVLFADKLDQRVVHTCAGGLPEARAWREAVEEKELVLGAQHAVVALLGLGDAMLVLAQHLGLGESDRVHAHQGLALHVGAPVRA